VSFWAPQIRLPAFIFLFLFNPLSFRIILLGLCGIPLRLLRRFLSHPRSGSRRHLLYPQHAESLSLWASGLSAG
jgi:hypothetical protein